MLYGKEHVARYQETDGAEGHDWNGTVTLLLTTKGRRTGKEHTTPLIYQPDGDAYVIVASKGGAEDDPLWFKNIEADPQVKVQVKDDRFTAHARVAGPDEKPALWRKMAAVWPDYDEYQKKTDRQIPVVILERV
ncbi:nitroreductase family deazaflavin-dependent oxidoreductase [Actinomadura decatromicini]|uniref:Nitroreductase family deazaflavin-dependent oxidoreductase n=1 Tax=Actinomadura decatromicini TaxID=2604572 RepID=A0A5D3F485_9ACTN|nr:nitroreductase family deazaflavin-dependent oxidoreductase [Actinomadura decatromicini]TYK42794.1 nitroreductase family deazaflavin-dependent oxidoreductase [Actinomadura decatromicini]